MGINTPEWVYRPAKLAIYFDGMPRGLHGDPKTGKRDQLLRDDLELDGYTVVVIQSRDLNDPEAMRSYLSAIAAAIGQRTS